MDVAYNYSSESTHKFRESLIVAPTKLCAPIFQIFNARSAVLATSVPALLDVVNSVKNRNRSSLTEGQYVLMSQITTLVVGVNVNLVAGSRPLFFGLVRLTHLVWQPNAVVKGCNSALW